MNNGLNGISYGMPTKGGFNIRVRSMPLDSRPLLRTGKVGGFFADYECKAATKIVLVQDEVQTRLAKGALRDALFVNHIDRDVTDYGTEQHESFAIRGFMTGRIDGSSYTAQNRDFGGGWFAAVGNSSGTARGTSALLANSIQYGTGVCTNEFWGTNPAAAAGGQAQSSGVQAVIAVLQADFADADPTHIVRGVHVENLAKRATYAFGANSTGNGVDPGDYQSLLDGTTAIVSSAAIIMPLSSAGSAGTTIAYDNNDWTQYDRTNNRWQWFVGGTVRGALSATAFIMGDTTPITALGGVPKVQAVGTDLTASVVSGRFSADASAPRLAMVKSRNATIGSHTVVQSGDTIGELLAQGSDGTGFIDAAAITFQSDGTPGTNDMPGRMVFRTTADGASTLTERARLDSSGFFNVTAGSFGRAAPVTKTADFTVAATENWIIVNKASSCTVTLPSASSFTGREITIKTIQAQTVVSASSNVAPRTDSAAGTAILAATDGAWATLVSDGTNWICMAGNP